MPYFYKLISFKSWIVIKLEITGEEFNLDHE